MSDTSARAPLNDDARAALRAEVGAAEYKGMSASAIASSLNAPTVTEGSPIRIGVTSAAVQRIVVPTSELYAINKLAAGDTPIAAAAWSFARMLERFVVIETDQPDILEAAEQAMAALVAAGALSAASRDAILALTQGTSASVSRHPRIVDVWMGIAEAPNAVTADEVAEVMV